MALLVICAAVTMREPRFLQGANLKQVALSATLVCIVALGEALVIIARQIDLSVGAMVAMSAFISAEWLEHHRLRCCGHRRRLYRSRNTNSGPGRRSWRG
jgi:rhamnose transport system permease protein